jgi:hypothetical protein
MCTSLGRVSLESVGLIERVVGFHRLEACIKLCMLLELSGR